jgi:hypothetical protein
MKFATIQNIAAFLITSAGFVQSHGIHEGNLGTFDEDSLAGQQFLRKAKQDGSLPNTTLKDKEWHGNDDKPFWVNNYRWESRKAFFEGGGRCHTREPTAEEKEQNAKVLRKWHDGDEKHRHLQGSFNVPVNVVVFTSSSGIGDVTQQQIDTQIAVLNAAYNPYFVFYVFNIQRIRNTALFNCDYNNDTPIKTGNRRGGAETMNLYLCDPVGGDLGWATFPSSGASNWDDGVVLNYATLPGGTLAPYNLGDVSGSSDIIQCLESRFSDTEFFTLADPRA